MNYGHHPEREFVQFIRVGMVSYVDDDQGERRKPERLGMDMRLS